MIFDKTGQLVEHTLDGNPQPMQAARAQQPKEWPLWAKSLKQFATSDDKGIGDVVARMIGNEKSIAFKTWFRATFNRDCGCDGRQSEWNRRFPLNE